MKENKYVKTTKNIIYLTLTVISLTCLALSPRVQGACEEGCDLTNASTFLGDNALSSNTAGFNNTAIGSSALTSNSTGAANTAIGYQALASNTVGFNNTADGAGALSVNSVGGGNTAIGQLALASNAAGNNNTASGFNALVTNTGDRNTANGTGSLENNTTGSDNIAVGNGAGLNLTTGGNNIDIGNEGIAAESKTIRIGTRGVQKATFIAGIGGATVPTGIPVLVDANGRLGTTTSSARFKDAITPMDKTSEAILSLKPVTFRYKHDLDPDGIPQFGLVAEQVEKISPDLVAHDEQGKPYSVRYEAVNAMLLNEFLKEHRHVQDQDATIARQQKQIEALSAQIQKVSVQFELGKSTPKRVVTNH